MTLYVSKLKKYSFYRLLKSNNVDRLLHFDKFAFTKMPRFK
jgi:hypothetical protein